MSYLYHCFWVHFMHTHDIVPVIDLVSRTSAQDFRRTACHLVQFKLHWKYSPLLEQSFPSLELLLPFSPYCFSSELVQIWMLTQTVFMFCVYLVIDCENFDYTGNSVNKMSPYFTSSSVLLYSVWWLSLFVVLTKQVSTEAVYLCQFWSTTLRWQLWCSWGQRLYSCFKSWSLSMAKPPPSSLLLYHLYAGVSV